MHEASAHALHLSRLPPRAQGSLPPAARVQGKSGSGQAVQAKGDMLCCSMVMKSTMSAANSKQANYLKMPAKALHPIGAIIPLPSSGHNPRVIFSIKIFLG